MIKHIIIDDIKVISLASDDTKQREITKKLIDIDYECFGDTNTSDQGTLDYWLKNRVASFVELLLFNNEIVGYLDFLAINQSGVKQLESGNWRDGEININFLSEKENRKISLYLVSIAIKKEFRGLGLSKKLWNSA